MSSWPDSDDEIAYEESDDEEDYSGDGWEDEEIVDFLLIVG